MKRLLFIIFLFFASQVQADTYNWYFSTSGSGSTCSEGSPCRWVSNREYGYTSGTTAQKLIDDATVADTVNLYFKRGDTWQFNTAQAEEIINYGLLVEADDPVVHIDAYGSGAKPKFDGMVTDFSTVPERDIDGSDGYDPPYVWNRIITLEKDYSSVKNIHINGTYGLAINLGSGWDPKYADYVTIESCEFSDIGKTAVSANEYHGTSNSTITKNLMYRIQQLNKYGKEPYNWEGAAIGLSPTPGDQRQGVDNTVSYNVIYDVGGEGIHSVYGTVEYNVIGDTLSVGIYYCPTEGDAQDAIIRYNLITMSGTDNYRYYAELSSIGIGIADEYSGGSNADAKVEVYGNILINRYRGIYVTDYKHESPIGEIRIYNNTIIDSVSSNISIAYMNAVAAGKGFIYNNASILYDRTSSIHAISWQGYTGFSTYWTVDNNAFWTTGGSPTVDLAWRTNYKVANPLLAGEEQETPVDWDGQTGATYFSDITFANITPNTGSSLIDTGKTLAYEDTFLSAATFADLPATQTFTLDDQAGNWDIGAALVSFDPTPTFVSAQIDPSGTTASVTFSEALTSAADVGTFAFTDFAGGAIVATYSSGEGTATLTFALDRTVAGSETDGLLEYTPGDWVDSDSNALATFSGETVSNYSGVPDPTPPNYTATTTYNQY